MTRRFKESLAAAVLFAASGCAIGYDTTLFMTKSNFGLDVDSKPPTAEISIARREGVLEPAFDGDTLPVVAGFSSKTGALENYLFGISSVFAGGEAANIVTDLEDQHIDLDPEPLDPEAGQRLCLAEKPKGRLLFWTYESLAPQPNEVRPLAFGTDTTLGVKLAWSGLTAQFPDTIRVGFQRKELAIAPVSGREVECRGPPAGVGTYEVWMPSFLAWISIDANTGALANTRLGYAQGFATGKAAEQWARVDKLKKLVLERSAGDELAAKVFNRHPDAIARAQRIDAWLDEDEARSAQLRSWLIENGMIEDKPLAEADWLNSASQNQLQSAIDHFEIA